MQRLFHFSQDPAIKSFEPHVARTSDEKNPFVWAVDELHAPSYWFPRDCPRVCCWAAGSQWEGNSLIALGGAHRLHAVELDWVERFRHCQLYVYEFDPAPFMPKIPDAGFGLRGTTLFRSQWNPLVICFHVTLKRESNFGS